MKNRILWLLATALLAPAALVAASSPFEGRVNFAMTPAGGKAQDVNYAVKNGKIRVEMSGQPGMMGAMIIDPVSRQSTILMDQQKMYMTMSVPELAAKADKDGTTNGTLTKTGETEKILGYTAEKYISTVKDVTTELWLAEGLGTFVPFGGGAGGPGGRRGGGPGGPTMQGWEQALAGKELFPVRVVSRDKANKETFRMEATKIEKQTLPDTLFTPPADYQKFDMGSMMKGMMPGAR